MILFTGVGHPQTVDYAEYSLISFGKPLALLGVAGVDKVFYRATATIKSSRVKVESGQASTSVAVRHACKEFVTSDLFSDDGMLTSSFQTDTRDLAATPLKSTTDNLFLPFMRRRTFLKNVPPLGLAVLSLPSVAGSTPAALPSDRTYWVQMLTRLAEPILDALANDRLRLQMPVEARAKVTDRPQYAHLEAFGRLLAGIGPWLALTTDDEIGLRTDYRLLVSRALANAVNPQARDFLNFSTGAQPLVDASFLAQGLLRAPVIWEQASAFTKTQLLDALRQTRRIKPGFNN